jgi:protein PhnA
MSISEKLSARNQGQCELCNAEAATVEYTVSPKDDSTIDHQVALCNTCSSKIDSTTDPFHWRCLEGSIWSMEPAVQALSYRILQNYQGESWASDLLSSIDLDETVVTWALHSANQGGQHKDAFGNVLEAGDTVVLTQALNVKGTNFTASKGTVVKRIRLVPDNPGQIEGKVNEQMIVILTQYVKKG